MLAPAATRPRASVTSPSAARQLTGSRDSTDARSTPRGAQCGGSVTTRVTARFAGGGAVGA